MGNAIHAECPKCGTSATGMRNVRELFSTRRNAQMEVIPQSWCKSCRNGKKGKSPKAKSAKPKAVKPVKKETPKVKKPAARTTATSAKSKHAPKSSAASVAPTAEVVSSTTGGSPSIKALYKQHYPNDKASRGTRFMEAKLIRKGVLPVQSKAVEEKGSVDFI
jgi:phage tail sheath protein FI